MRWRRGFGLFLALGIALSAALPGAAAAADAAYAVDTSEVSDPGACKLDSWVSFASNKDYLAAVNPACVVSLYRPVELSMQVAGGHSDGERFASFTPKIKTKFLDSGVGVFGLGASASAGINPATGENTSVSIVVPSTVRFSDQMRLNLNAGWLWDRPADRHYFLYGAGFDWRNSENVWIATAEVFGILGDLPAGGAPEIRSLVQPRAQLGLRYRPISALSFDLVYGRNITGEKANWLTLATTYRFPTEAGVKHRD